MLAPIPSGNNAETLHHLELNAKALGEEWIDSYKEKDVDILDPLAAPFLVRGTPSNRLGLRALIRHPAAFVFAVLQVIAIICAVLLAYDKIFGSGTTTHTVISVIALLMLANVFVLAKSMVITGGTLSGLYWRIPAAAILGVVPLRFFADMINPKWIRPSQYYPELIIGIEGHILSFILIYALGKKIDPIYAWHDLALSLRRDGARLYDSIGTYVSMWPLVIPILVILLVVIMDVVIPEPLSSGPWVVGFCVGIIIFARALLGAYIFDVLSRYSPMTHSYSQGSCIEQDHAAAAIEVFQFSHE